MCGRKKKEPKAPTPEETLVEMQVEEAEAAKEQVREDVEKKKEEDVAAAVEAQDTVRSEIEVKPEAPKPEDTRTPTTLLSSAAKSGEVKAPDVIRRGGRGRRSLLSSMSGGMGFFSRYR